MDLSFDELAVSLGYAVLMGSAAPSSSAPAAKAAPAKKAAVADDDDFDMFDDDEEDEDAEAAAEKARHARMQKALDLKLAADAKKEKKAPKEKMVEKSLVVLEVKPWEADTDLKMVWNKIKEYQQEGLVWGENFKLEPVAFGIMKLVMTCCIVDSLVLLDDVTENIEAIDEYVQSVNIASMNKV